MDDSVEVLIPILVSHHMNDICKILLRWLLGGHRMYISQLVELCPSLLVDSVEFKSFLGGSSGSIIHLAAATGRIAMFDFHVNVGGQLHIKDSV